VAAGDRRHALRGAWGRIVPGCWERAASPATRTPGAAWLRLRAPSRAVPRCGSPGGGGGQKPYAVELQAWGVAHGSVSVGESAHLSVAPTAAGFGVVLLSLSLPYVGSSSSSSSSQGFMGLLSFQATMATTALSQQQEEEPPPQTPAWLASSGAALLRYVGPSTPRRAFRLEQEDSRATGRRCGMPQRAWPSSAGSEPSRLSQAKASDRVASSPGSRQVERITLLTGAPHQSKAQTRSERVGWNDDRSVMIASWSLTPCFLPSLQSAGKYGWWPPDRP